MAFSDSKTPSTLTCNFLNTLRPTQNGRHFPDDIFKCIFFNENVWISIKISLTFVPKGPINNIPALFQIMAWRRPVGKPLSEPMMVNLLTHLCVTRPLRLRVSSQISWDVEMADTTVKPLASICSSVYIISFVMQTYAINRNDISVSCTIASHDEYID